MNSCIVMGNGPSLKSVPLDWLKQYPTFGGNGVYKFFEPTWYVYIDPDFDKFHTYSQEIDAIRSKKFIHSDYAHLINGSTPLHIAHEKKFSFSPLNHVYGYHSVVTVMLQLAYWLEFDEVRLVGLDHRYSTPHGAREWHTAEEDTNHFTDGYYRDGMTWKAPHLPRLAEWFAMAREIFEKDGRKIVNYTPESALEVFEHASIS